MTSGATTMRANFLFSIRALAAFCVVPWLLGACAAPKGGVVPQRYDLGELASPASPTALPAAPVWLGDVQAPSSLDGNLMVYRLAYSDPLQSRAYAQARWSMPVPELVEQRLRQRLALRQVVLNPSDGVQGRQPGVVLRVDLEDFSQTFSAPDQAHARVRLRATLSAWRGGVEQLLDQQTFESTQPCGSADAPGGVRALALASDTAFEALERWLSSAAPR